MVGLGALGQAVELRSTDADLLCSYASFLWALNAHREVSAAHDPRNTGDNPPARRRGRALRARSPFYNSHCAIQPACMFRPPEMLP